MWEIIIYWIIVNKLIVLTEWIMSPIFLLLPAWTPTGQRCALWEQDWIFIPDVFTHASQTLLFWCDLTYVVFYTLFFFIPYFMFPICCFIFHTYIWVPNFVFIHYNLITVLHSVLCFARIIMRSLRFTFCCLRNILKSHSMGAFFFHFLTISYTILCVLCTIFCFLYCIYCTVLIFLYIHSVITASLILNFAHRWGT